MADPLAGGPYAGWSAAEIEADRALANCVFALGQADGLLNPALDPIFAGAAARSERASQISTVPKPRRVRPLESRSGSVSDLP